MEFRGRGHYRSSSRLLWRRYIFFGTAVLLVALAAFVVAWRPGVGTLLKASFARFIPTTEAGNPQAPSVPLGQRLNTSLADGTVLVLNSGSRVEARLDARVRELSIIEGEVVANIANEARRPFVVSMGSVEVQTTAAKLLVRRDPGGAARVIVLSGAGWLLPARQNRDPRVSRYLQPVLLTTGQSALVRPGVRIITRLEPAHIDRALAWTHGVIWLEGETLAEAVAEFNRYNRMQLVIGDKKIADLRIGGRFEANDVESFVKALRKTFGIQAEKSGKRMTLKSK